MRAVAVADERFGKDWAGDWRSLGMMWALPGATMAGATLLEPIPRAVIWIAMLLWMSGACIANARRCRRTHYRFTGPFFLVMPMAVASYVLGLLPLGSHGWALLGGATLAGFAVLWWASEHVWGMFSH
jgi:hypothetical protein